MEHNHLEGSETKISATNTAGFIVVIKHCQMAFLCTKSETIIACLTDSAGRMSP
jgi:hypothetical protein